MMQPIYTGLRDMHGDKVYSGDTVRGIEETPDINFPNEWKGKVVLQRGSFRIPNPNNGGVCIGDLTRMEIIKRGKR